MVSCGGGFAADRNVPAVGCIVFLQNSCTEVLAPVLQNVTLQM
jgi:hypothetical protein